MDKKNNLYEEQATEDMLVLLGAQKQLYIDAKNIYAIIIFFSFITSLVFPIVKHYYHSLSDLEIFLGAIALILVELIFMNAPERKMDKAATIQEQFDTKLFKLEWNQGLVGDKIDNLFIARANNKLSKRKRGNVKKGTHWYGDYRSKELPLAILLCQKENLYWDAEQKKYYKIFNFVLIFIALGISILVGNFFWDLNKNELLSQSLLPLLPLVVLLIKSILKIGKSERILEPANEKANRLKYGFEENQIQIKYFDLRDIQDRIFKNRKEGNLVPELFYKIFKRGFKKTIQSQTDQP